MNGMEQRPFLIQRDLLVFQFLLDRTETTDHDVLSDTRIHFLLFDLAIISPGSDHMIPGKIRL